MIIHGNVKIPYFNFSLMPETKTLKKKTPSRERRTKEKKHPKEKKKRTHKVSAQQVEHEIASQVDRRLLSITGKTSALISLEAKHNVSVTVSPKATKAFKLVFIKKVLSDKLSGRGTIKERLGKCSATELTNFKSFRRELTSFLFGTQEPELKLALQTGYMSSSGASLYIPVVSIGWPIVIDRSDWDDVFDEVKVLHGKWKFRALLPYASTTSGIVRVAVGVIDYNNNTAFSTFDEADAYDTKKHYYLEFLPGEKSQQSWTWKDQGIPDLSWIATTDTTTYVCFHKNIFFGAGTVLTSTNYGLGHGHAFVRFRQVN